MAKSAKKLTMKDVQEPIDTAAPEVRTLIKRVLQAEKAKLYQKNPRSIKDELLEIVKQVIS